ncbi:BZ3500_MvSof-1268-A1-R1_Chr2-1g04556 [Microbotryum saponariae]|uniref:BZ3500_MvSof-1268-A1-R1_Chr2-1g04556 protein n=1 Tax=Microbotryum saponariae TaxID=289078 RepID=A0A2X0KLJ6_9BASI|nr:BZ3500_MvSof-1268-A1-R1_Chr2-1g04556 [Microbotryum saponariae]SCZ92016.1 BZ3501_MvSof-1269-A2-R1_Chr2-1g04212 [Microbotryum saponariae]
MLFSRVVFVATSLFAASAHSLISLPIKINAGNLLGADLDLGLLQDGTLVNLDAFANVLSTTRCPSATIGITSVVNVLGITLARVCACVNALDLVNNIDSITGQCVKISDCPSPNVITPTGSGNSFCKCVSPFVSNGGNGCVMPSTMSARSRRKVKKWISHPHAAQASQDVLSSNPSVLPPIDPEAETCPDGEKACRLKTGGFECIDATNALTACGGFVGDGLPGQNCLAIPGALNVQCHNSECQATSCFRG